MKQETYLRTCVTSMVAAVMILITLFSGLSILDGFGGEVSAGGGDFADGDGTPNDPYQIEDILDLQNMSADLSAHYVLVNDINASATMGWNDGIGFEPIGDYSNRFTGNLDGQGHKITRLFVNRASEKDVGLFGCVGTGGSVSNISLVNVNISGNNRVGGFVGSNYGTVDNSYATGNVSGNSPVGGLVGHNDGTVDNSYATGNVSGNYYVGGLVGWNYDGTVQNCYTTGNVSGDRRVGGLVGNNSGTVKNCYATGTVSGGDSYVGGLVGSNSGMVQNCFWDIETSGHTTSDGGTGKNTTDMVKKCTFTDAGWDFHDTWNIIEGESYPYLRSLEITILPDLDGDENESFFSQKIGSLPLYAYPVFVIIGLAVGAGTLKMKGGKSGGEAQKPEQPH